MPWCRGWYVAAGLVAGCSLGQGASEAEQEVARFHADLNAGRTAAIWSRASDAFRKNISQAAFDQYAAAVRRKLGPFKSGTAEGWREVSGTSGRVVTLTYKSQFANGAAVETFAYRIEEGKPKLAGFNISSPVLVLN